MQNVVTRWQKIEDLNWISFKISVTESVYENVMLSGNWPKGDTVRDFERRPHSRTVGAFFQEHPACNRDVVPTITSHSLATALKDGSLPTFLNSNNITNFVCNQFLIDVVESLSIYYQNDRGHRTKTKSFSVSVDS